MSLSINYDKPFYGYISSGNLNRMFTLRIVYEAYDYVNGVCKVTTSSDYIRNLSTNYDNALEKAKGILSIMGIKFSENGEFDLDSIERKKSYDILPDENVEYKEVIQEINRLKQFADEVELYIGDGKIVGGKYNGMTVEEIANIDIGYIRWFQSTFKDAKKSHHYANWKMFNQWADENLFESEWIGSVGDMIEVDLKYIRSSSYKSSFGHNTVGWLHFFEDNAGNLIKISSVAKFIMELESGEKLKIKATIKKHDIDWMDSKVTVLNRPKKVK